MTQRVRDLQLGHQDVSSAVQCPIGKLPVGCSLEIQTLKQPSG